MDAKPVMAYVPDTEHCYQIANRGVFEPEGTILNVSILSSYNTMTPNLTEHPNINVFWFTIKDFIAQDGSRLRIYYAAKDGSRPAGWYQKILTTEATTTWPLSYVLAVSGWPKKAPAYTLRSVFTEVLAKL